MCFNTLYQFFWGFFFVVVVFFRKKNCGFKKSPLNEIVSYKNLNFMFISENVRTNKVVTHVVVLDGTHHHLD